MASAANDRFQSMGITGRANRECRLSTPCSHSRLVETIDRARPQPTAQADPSETFMPAPAAGRVAQEADIRDRLLVMPATGSCQLIEQRLCLLQVGGVEALGEPAVDRREEITGSSVIGGPGGDFMSLAL